MRCGAAGAEAEARRRRRGQPRLSFGALVRAARCRSRAIKDAPLWEIMHGRFHTYEFWRLPVARNSPTNIAGEALEPLGAA